MWFSSSEDEEEEEVMEETFSTWEHFPAEEIDLHKINILISPCGTGKTSAIKTFLKTNLQNEDTMIVLTFRQTLAMKLSKDLDCTNYLAFKDRKYINLEEEKKVVISPESFSRLFKYEDNDFQIELPSILIIDEWMSFLDHIFNDCTLNITKRTLFFKFFVAMMQNEWKTIVLADAYIQESSIQTFERVAALKQIPLKRFRIIRNEYKGVEKTIYYTHSYPKWKQLLDCATTAKDQKLYVFSNWKSVLDGLQNCYTTFFGSNTQSYPRQVFNSSYYISSDSSMEQKDESSTSPDMIWVDYDHVYASPTIAAGISCDVMHFDRAFGFAGSNSTNALSTLQLMCRVRNLRKAEVVLYCIPPYRASKAKKRRVTSNFYSYDEVMEMLSSASSIIKKNYKDCRKMGFTYTQNHLRVKFDMKNVMNQFLIEVVMGDLNSKVAYIDVLKRYAAVDNYTFKFIDNPTFKTLHTEATSSLNEEAASFSQTTDKTIPKTMKNAKAFRLNLLSGWDGMMEFSEMICSPVLMQLCAFFETWNVLGLYGNYSDMIKNHPDPNIAKHVKFNNTRCAQFYNDLVYGNHQPVFHNFISSHIAFEIQQDAFEYKGGGFKVNSIENVIFNDLIAIFKVSPVFNYTISDWFGNQHTSSFKGSIWNDVVSTEENIPIYQQEYIQEATQIRQLANNLFSSLKEETINNEESIKKLVVLFRTNWSAVLSSKLLLNAIDLKKLKTKAVDPELVPFLRTGAPIHEQAPVVELAITVIKRLFRKIGLKLQAVGNRNRKKPIFATTKLRVFKKYEILNFKERLMLSVLKYLQDSKKTPLDVLHYPEEDPFRLLEYNPRCFMLNNYLNRFKRETRDKYVPITNYIIQNSTLNSPLDAYFGNPGMPALEHIHANLNNIVVHCFFWKFYNNLNNEKFPNSSNLYTPAFYVERLAILHSYVEYTHQPDLTRVEIREGYSSESFDALSLLEQAQILNQLQQSV